MLLALGSGCAGTTPTLIQTSALCRDWQVYRPAKGDKLTPRSAAVLLGNNEARVVYGCAKKENQAAS